MLKEEEGQKGEVSTFQALCISMSATIGTGNITAVASAITIGGPGALLWMIITAFFGMATKYAEGFLAVKYRKIENDRIIGGPYAYIEYGKRGHHNVMYYKKENDSWKIGKTKLGRINSYHIINDNI